MAAELTRQLDALRKAGADVLLVDLMGNGGGTEWADAAVRMVTGVQLKAEKVGFVRGPQWATSLGEKERDLRAAADRETGLDRERLLQLADQADVLRREAETPCDSTPMWHGKRPDCQWLGGGVYSTGPLDSMPEWAKGKSWAPLVFQPAKFKYRAGVWTGPLIVLVDQGSASASEGFAAQLQDSRAAVIVGAPTLGAGCGHTDGSAPTILKHSGATFEMPDCARFRADGSNEILSIQPDILVGLRSQDGPHRRAGLIAEKLPDAVEQAVRQRTPAASGIAIAPH
jgi:C-terminal processing protease CtpA/Prc